MDGRVTDCRRKRFDQTGAAPSPRESVNPMTMGLQYRFPMKLVAGILSFCLCSALDADDKPETQVVKVRDLLWVWGNPEMGQPGADSAGDYAAATPAKRAEILGTPNIVMAGSGLPHDRELAAEWSDEVSHAPRLVWEIISDSHQEHKPPFEFRRRIAGIAPLVEEYPQIEAVMVDDMTSVAASKGFEPEHLRSIKSLLAKHDLPLELWGVLYTMNFDKPTTDPLVQELDVINLWHWHGQDTADMEEHVSECEQRYPGKPIILGLYMYDYGSGRRMPLELHEKQCETALSLLRANRVSGLVFLSITNDEEVVDWTADWIEKVGNEEIEVSTR